MKLRSLIILLSFSAQLAVAATKSDSPVTTEHKACEVVRAAGSRLHLANENGPGAYWCGVAVVRKGYWVVDLHRGDETAPDDWHGSSLVGYYGVRMKDGEVFEWNVIDETPVRPATAQSTEREVANGAIE
ncbi:MAG TPA: hypothetical protein VHD32_16380 [Candidatus Didemnitutus sp.]|nr:hypothetical protein [Candidatus Didemnitutus sp.]